MICCITKENHLRKPSSLLIPTTVGLVTLAALLVLGSRRTGAVTPQVGCVPDTLTVRTGQSFYFSVVVSDVVDLYAWQTDVTFDPAYLAYEGLVWGDMLSQDGATVFSMPPGPG